MLVLIGVAAAFRTFAFPPHMTKPSVASKLAQTNHPVAVPPPQAEVNAFVLMGEAPPMPKPSFLATAQKAAATPMRTSAR